MTESEFGDFKEIIEETKKTFPESSDQQESPRRIKQPKPGQFLGVVIQRLGSNRMSVKSTDNKTRNCRVPGRFRRRFWLRPGDPVIIQPWPDDDNKADIIYQYRKNESYQLKKSAIIKKIQEEF